MMETNQNPNPTTSLFQLNLDAQNSYNLRSAATWAKVHGVVGIITGIILIVLMAVTLSKLGSYSGGYYRNRGLDGMFATKTGAWMMIIAGIVSTIGGIFAFIFGNKINAALQASHQNGLNEGFAALRNFFTVRSILLIIVFLLMLVALSSLI